MNKKRTLLALAAACLLIGAFVACSKDDDKKSTTTCTCIDNDGSVVSGINPADYGASSCEALANKFGTSCW